MKNTKSLALIEEEVKEEKEATLVRAARNENDDTEKNISNRQIFRKSKELIGEERQKEELTKQLG